MHFYELHEGDDQVFADLLLAREEEMEPEEFFDVVQSIRRRDRSVADESAKSAKADLAGRIEAVAEPAAAGMSFSMTTVIESGFSATASPS